MERLKRITIALVLATFAVAFAGAEPAGTVKGTVASIDGNKVVLTLAGEKASWVKKGAGLKFGADGVGKIVEVTATSIAFNTKQVSKLKVGDEIALAKGKVAPVGC